MAEIIRVGLDTSKSVFQLHGVDAAERPVLLRKLRRGGLEGVFAGLPRTMIGVEAWGGLPHWARVLSRLRREVRLLPPQFVEPSLKRGQTPAAAAGAICDGV